MRSKARARRALAVLVGALAALLTFGAVLLLADDGAGPAPVAGAESSGAALFARMGCGSCHRLAAAGSSGRIGPSLDDVLPAHTAESLRTKILNEGGTSAMPTDFGERMSGPELDALVAYLLEARHRP